MVESSPSDGAPDRPFEGDSPGPRTLEERALLGIFVHLIAVPTGIIGAGTIYVIANHEFTVENARHALNWHLGITLLLVVSVGAFGIVAIQEEFGVVIFPDVIDVLFFLIAFVGIFVLSIAWFLTFLFSIIAMVKAIFGTAWKYPVVPEFIK